MSLRIGIGLGIPFNHGAGVDWAAYWIAHPEAKTFIDATGSTNETEWLAIGTLVDDLKAINATQANFVNFGTPASSICRAIYPFIGTTAASQKWNLIDPQDADASFRIIWANDAAGAHTANGYVSDGINQYADTKFNPSVRLAVNNSHVSIHSNNAGFPYLGAWANNQNFYLSPKYAQVSFYSSSAHSVIIFSTENETPEDATGFTCGNRLSTTYLSLFKNGKKLDSRTDLMTLGTYPNLNLWIGGRNHATTPVYCAGTHCFASIGSGITDAANVLYAAAVKKFMIALGRRTADTSKVKAGIALGADDTYRLLQLKPISWFYAMNNIKHSNSLDGETAFTGNYLKEGLKHVFNGGALANHSLVYETCAIYLAVPHTAQEYFDNIVDPQTTAINTAFSVDCKTFAYPGNAAVAEVNTLLLANGMTLVRGNIGSSYYDGTSQSISTISLNNVSYSIAEYKAMIDNALANNRILPMHMHDFSDNADTNSISIANFKEIIEYIVSKNMTFYTYDELLPALFA